MAVDFHVPHSSNMKEINTCTDLIFISNTWNSKWPEISNIYNKYNYCNDNFFTALQSIKQ